MSWLSRLMGGKSDSEQKSQRLDYLKEALALERQGDFDAALTSYRLALREKPDDVRILENMAIAYTRMKRADEAIRCYRRALELAPALPAAHYGLGFILLKRGDQEGAKEHLESFLASPPNGTDMTAWIAAAREALSHLETPVTPLEPPPRNHEPPALER